MIEIIALDKLYVDPVYQRPPNERQIKKLVENWDDDAGGVFPVSPNENGMYAVLDGQQRLEALRRRGESAWFCDVRHLTPPQQAAVFTKINKDRKPVTGFGIFKAQLAAGDETALAVTRVLAEVERYAAAGISSKHHVTALGTCVGILGRYGEDHFRDITTALHIAWPDESFAFSRGFLLGASYCIRRHRLTPEKFGAAWSRAGCRTVDQQARFEYTSGSQMDTGFGFYKALVSVYNRGRRSGRIEATERLRIGNKFETIA